MHNTDTTGTPPGAVADPLTMRELATVLVKHYGIHEGKFDLLIEFQIGMGLLGPSPELTNPGAMISVSKIGLVQSPPVDGPMTVDAAIVNPPIKVHKKTKSSQDKS